MAIQNEQSVEIKPTTSSEMSTSNNKSFDLWYYHITLASVQIQHRTMSVN